MPVVALPGALEDGLRVLPDGRDAAFSVHDADDPGRAKEGEKGEVKMHL